MNKLQLTVSLPIIVYVLLHYIPFINQHHYLWGTDIFRFLPPLFTVFITVIILISFSPKIQAIIAALIERIMNSIRSNMIQSEIIIVAVFVGLAILFADHTHLLGDGRLILRSMQGGVALGIPEPLESLLLYWGYLLGINIFNLSSEISASLLSIVSAGFFIYLVLLSCRSFGNDIQKKLFLGGALVFVPSTQLFFGYVEYYSITSCLLLLFIYMYLKSFNSIKYCYWVAFTAGLLISFHISMIVILPSLFYLLFIQLIWKKYITLRQALSGLILFLIPIGMTVIILRTFGLGWNDLTLELKNSNNFLPFSLPKENTEFGYSLFSASHIIEFVVFLLFALPFLWCTILFWFKEVQNRKVWKIYEFVGLTILLSTMLFVAFALSNKLGWSRDWDRFSMIAYPLGFWLLFLINFEERNFRLTILPLLIIAFIHTFSFILINTRYGWAIPRFEHLVKNPDWSRTAKSNAFDELKGYFRDTNDLDKHIYYSQQNVTTITNSARNYYNLGYSYHLKGDFKEALNAYYKCLELDPEFHDALNNIGSIFLKTNQVEQAENIFLDLYKKRPDIPRYRNNYLNALFQGKKYEHGIRFIKEALKSTPEDAQLYIYAGEFYEETKSLDIALSHYQNAIKYDPSITLSYIHAGNVLLHLGRKDEAISVLTKGILSNPNDLKLQINFGLALYNSGKKFEGYDYFMELNRRYPENQEIKKYLSVLKY